MLLAYTCIQNSLENIFYKFGVNYRLIETSSENLILLGFFFFLLQISKEKRERNKIIE